MVDQFGRWYPDFPGQQPWQDAAYARATGQMGVQPGQGSQGTQQAQGGQAMTPPTIRAEIIQVDSVEAIDRCPQAPGTSQMYMTKDEGNIVVRSVLANGQHTDVIYDKRPPAPPEPKINPADYVRRDEIAAMIDEEISRLAAKHKEKNGDGTV